MKRLLTIVLIALYSCSQAPSPEYIKEMESWRATRLVNLKTENGFVNLAGLFWLKPGPNTFGSAADNDLVFPPAFPEKAGVINLTDSIIILSEAAADITTFDDNTPPDTLVPNVGVELKVGTFRFHAIQRGDKFGVRLKDLDHPNLKRDIPIQSYPLDEKWIVKAKYMPYYPPKTLMILNVIGITYPEKCPGYLTFDVNGTEYQLDLVVEGDKFFIIFGDETNGNETYGSGKYLYASMPDENGEVVLDFNKSYNPPCAFTEFATCPLPPSQNKLDIKIEAGEKDFHW